VNLITNIAKREALQRILNTQNLSSWARAEGLAQMLQLHGKAQLRTLLIDMDEVVAELLKYCYAQHAENTGIKHNHLDIEEWSFSGVHVAHIWEKPGTFELLEVTKDAQEVLLDLQKRGFEIFFLTSPPTIHSVQEKMKWVEKHFPFIGWSHVIAFQHKHMIDGDLLFDDSPRNLDTYDKGLRIACDRKYNRTAKAHARVSGWWQFHELVWMTQQQMKSRLFNE
jgi:5'-nucleotidase